MRSLDIEQGFEQRAIDYTYKPEVPLSDFDFSRSLENQARLMPLQDTVVANYAEAFRRGDQFPAVVAYKGPRGLVLTDGNHRLNAAKMAGVGTIDVYVVSTSDEMLRVLTVEANSKHGMPPSDEERKMHAVFLVNAGATVKDAAAVTGLRVEAVHRAVEIERAERRARFFKPKGWSTLPGWVKARLNTLNNDPVFFKVAELAYMAKLNSGEVGKRVIELNKLGSQEDQLGLINRWQDELKSVIAKQGGGVFKRAIRAGGTPKLMLRANLHAVRSLAAQEVKNITKSERKDYENQFSLTIDVLMKAREELLNA